MGRIGCAEQALELASDLARCTRRADDQQPGDGGFVAEVRPPNPGRKRLRLVPRPPDLLFEPPQLGFDLGGDDQALPWLVKGDVDESTRRAANCDLDVGTPARTDDREQSLGDACLVTVADGGTGIRVVARREVRPERRAEPCIGLERRMGFARGDPREVWRRNVGRAGEFGHRHAGVGTEALEIAHEPDPELTRGPLASPRELRRAHDPIGALGAHRRRTGGSPVVRFPSVGLPRRNPPGHDSRGLSVAHDRSGSATTDPAPWLARHRPTVTSQGSNGPPSSAIRTCAVTPAAGLLTDREHVFYSS